jgi:SAM-dependent methyltransferase
VPRPDSAAKPSLRRIARQWIPEGLYRQLMTSWRRTRRFGQPVDWGNLRRERPLSWFGFERGMPIDRFYIEAFLDAHRSDIRGRVLEIEDDAYTRKFGSAAVEQRDVLYAAPRFPGATLTGDLSTGVGIPEAAFDCIILTQTLPFIYDIHAAVRHTFRALRPAGVLLATVPGITRVSLPDMDRWGEYWRLTSLSARRLLEEAFVPEQVSVRAYGSMLPAVAFLYGLAAEDLSIAELDRSDPEFEVLIGARAVRSAV